MAKETTLVRRLKDRAVAYAIEDKRIDLLAHSLDVWMGIENQTPSELAAFLGTDELGLRRLSLCRPPRTTSYQEDLGAIAEYTGCRPESLLHLLRRLEVLTTLAGSAQATGEQQGSSLSVTHAMLLAARDREVDTDA